MSRALLVLLACVFTLACYALTPELVAHVDTDGDGEIEQHEVDKLLDGIDADNDGIVSPFEMSDWLKARGYLPGDEHGTSLAAFVSKNAEAHESGGHKIATHHHRKTKTEFLRAHGFKRHDVSKEDAELLYSLLNADDDEHVEHHEWHRILDEIDTTNDGELDHSEISAFLDKHKLSPNVAPVLLLGWSGMDHSAPEPDDQEL